MAAPGSPPDRPLRALVTAAPLPDDGRPGMRERMLSLEDLRMVPPPEPLVDGLLDLDSLAFMYGRRGENKSTVAVDLTASIATGTRFHGRPVTQCPVIYVVGEGVAGLRQRYDEIGRASCRERV